MLFLSKFITWLSSSAYDCVHGRRMQQYYVEDVHFHLTYFQCSFSFSLKIGLRYTIKLIDL